MNAPARLSKTGSRLIAIFGCVGLAFFQFADSAAAQADAANEQIAASLRTLLLKHLPDPLYEASPNWGKKSNVKTMHWEGKGLKARPEIVDVAKNDGLWKKIHVMALAPQDNLKVILRDMKTSDDGVATFVIAVSTTVEFELTQQRWESGIKLYGASVRGQAVVKATLHGRAESRIDVAKGLPEMVLTLKITKADVGYDNLKFDHVAGIGGDGAKVIGDMAHTMLNQWKPSIERDLLAKANAAIVKAGDNREVHLGFGKLLKTGSPKK